MDNQNWNEKLEKLLEELKNNCSDSIIQDASIYIEAIRKKEKHITFLKEKLSNKSIPTGDRQEILQTKLNVEIYLESTTYNLHSLPDVIAHLIVVVIIKPLSPSLGLTIPEGRQINASKICQNLHGINRVLVTNQNSDKKDYIEKIEKSLQNLLESPDYKYIDALVNTIKHRHIIKSEYNFKQTFQSQTSDWNFVGFERDDLCYLKVTSQQLFERETAKILDLFHQIFQAINNYCIAKKNAYPTQ